MSHNSVQILTLQGEHDHYTDWLTARLLIEQQLAVVVGETPSRNRVTAIQMLTTKVSKGKRVEWEQWTPRMSGKYGPLVLQIETPRRRKEW